MSMDFAAIMFADVSGSSRLFKQLGDTSARAIIARIVAMMMDKTAAYQGTVIKTIGDECMSSFPDAAAAANAAMAIQNDISTTHYGAPLTIRIGFHYGAVIKEAGDVYGEAVNDAADLVKIAKGGQIITCQRTVDVLPSPLKERCGHFDEVRIKGGVAREKIYLMQWQEAQQDSNATQFMAVLDTAQFRVPDVASHLMIHYQGQQLTISKDKVPFSIGRDPASHLPVAFGAASRDHCKIDYRRGKFVLVDNSTNGTYVQLDGRNLLYLRREETPLSGAGIISFSADIDKDGPHRLHFQCE